MADQHEIKPPGSKPVDSAALADFFGSGCALIVDHSASSRPVLRRMLNGLGVKTSDVHIAENYGEALSLIKAHRPVIVFVDYKLGSHTALDLFCEYAQFVPNRLASIFVVISADNSSSTVTALADADVDVVMVRPLNIKDINEKFMKAAALKSQPTQYVKVIEAGRRFTEAGKHDQALRAFNEAQSLDPKPAKACSMAGALHRALGDFDAAFVAFKHGLVHEPSNYRCLLGVFEILCEQKKYPEAYKAGLAMLDHYPLHPRQIPEMIRLCIVNEKFAEVLRVAETALEQSLADEALSRYVIAGLFICGKHLLKNGQKSEAIQVLRKTEALSRAKPNIINEIIAILYSGGMVTEAEEMLRRAPAEAASSKEVRLAILEHLHVQGIDAKTFHLSRELIHEGVSTPTLFEIALLQAKGLRRPEAVVQDILLRGTQAFPNRKARFEELIGDKSVQEAAS